MGVALFKAKFRVSADRFEVAAIPLAAVEIGWVSLSAADAWQTGITRPNKGVESLLSLRLVVPGRSEFCQSCLAALTAGLLFGALALRFLLLSGFTGFCSLFFADRAGALKATNHLPFAYRVEPLATTLICALTAR